MWPKHTLNFLDITSLRGEQFRTKLLGGLREDLLQSPYSGLYLKPYIRRDTKIFPNWLKLMAEIQLAANENETDFVLPPRGPLDFVYVQPEHVPAVNSLCNQFFWPGIDCKGKFLFVIVCLNNDFSDRMSAISRLQLRGAISQTGGRICFCRTRCKSERKLHFVPFHEATLEKLRDSKVYAVPFDTGNEVLKHLRSTCIIFRLISDKPGKGSHSTRVC